MFVRHTMQPIIALVIAMAILAGNAYGQETTATAAKEKPAATAKTVTAAEEPTSTERLLENVNSEQVREEFNGVLRRYPPQVAKVLKLDPSLMRNETYMSSYPGLAAWLREHPDVPHHPNFYLHHVWIPGDPTPQTAAQEIWGDMFEGIAIFCSLGLAAAIFGWLIKTIIDHRRWNRLSKLQAEVHNKIMDRFQTNEDLLRYIQTSSGKRFLESAPIPLEAPKPLGAPFTRILWSTQVGVVLAMAGVGLQIVAANVDKEVSQPMFAMGMIGISVGLGFVLSAIVSFLISRKLGLWESRDETPTVVGE